MNFRLGHCLFGSVIIHGAIVCGLGTGSVYAKASISLANDVTGTTVSFTSAPWVPIEESHPVASVVQEEAVPQVITSELARLSIPKREKITKSKNQKKVVVNKQPFLAVNNKPIGRESGGLGNSGRSQAGVVRSPKPPYPPRALKARFEGRVTLNINIGVDGRVTNAKVLSSSGRADCDQSAVSTILNYWQFQPAYLNGRPVASTEQVTVVYEIER